MPRENILPKDTEITFPEFILLKASAGTGKTHALTLRFTQFLLSERIKNNHPRQILAITFTRNAAKEMKARIIGWLKNCYFETKPETINQILELTSIQRENLKSRAEKVLESILSNYSDFQVMTIDSFMAEVFKASAIDLGISPDFEITLDSTPIISYAFSRFLRRVSAQSPEGQLLREISLSLQDLKGSETAFVWDPTKEILDRFIELYRKLEASNRKPAIKDLTRARKELQESEKNWRDSWQRLKTLIETSSLEPNERSAVIKRLNSSRITDWLNCSFKVFPVKKPRSSREKIIYEQIEKEFLNFQDKINKYKEIYARNFFQPHLQIYHELLDLLNSVKKEQELVFLEDIHRQLANYLELGIVPDVYFCLGSNIYHYLIDEFQDTSPLQWRNLEPLIENALSQGGSLFIVGDTKQAIYSFREADYQIMVDFIIGNRNFAPAPTEIKELEINWRSNRVILDFVSKIFPEGMKSLPQDRPGLAEWKLAAEKSGLDNFNCLPAELKSESEEKGKPEAGYVEIEIIPRGRANDSSATNEETDVENNGEEDDDQITRLKKKVQDLVIELINRGYRYSDIAILAYKNKTVAEAAAWLNEKGIPFIPFSSLDIRRRQVIREILAFLQFLDFPLDDLNFSVFTSGQVFQKKAEAAGLVIAAETISEFIIDSRTNPRTAEAPLYTTFRDTFPEIWEKYFEPFFKAAGYFPLYDLVNQVYRAFSLFELFPEEEAALIKLLEVIKHFEGQGKSNLRDFIRFSTDPADDESIWTVDVPEEIPAVRIMTIHKAKGLGFPVVILLLYPEQPLYPTFYLREADKDSNNLGVEVLKLNRELISACPQLEEPYRNYELKDKVNRLNTLYVALTRAKKELYLIGAPGKNKIYPFNLLEALGFPLDKRYQSSPIKPPAIIKSSPQADLSSEEAAEKKISLHFFTGKISDFIQQRKSFGYLEQKRGQLLHALLAEIEYFLPGEDSRLKAILPESLVHEQNNPLLEEAFSLLKRSLSQPEIARYFQPKPGRIILREKELVNSRGELYRADRIVIDPELITVIDFKTGEEAGAEIKNLHWQQVKNYKAMLEEIYPEKKIEAVLIYLDQGYVEKVE